MNAEQLWAVLSVEENTFHRVVWPTDWSQVRGMNVFGEDVPFIGQTWGVDYLPVADRDRFEFYAGLDDVSLSLVPRRAEQEEGALSSAGAMWVRLDSAKQSQALERFRPVPSLVLREGNTVRRWALWFVSPHPNVMQLERGNRRLAHALGAKKKFAGAEQLFHPPGVTLKWGRDRRPLVVTIEFESGNVYTPGHVAGHLRDAPAAWQPDRVAA